MPSKCGNSSNVAVAGMKKTICPLDRKQRCTAVTALQKTHSAHPPKPHIIVLHIAVHILLASTPTYIHNKIVLQQV